MFEPTVDQTTPQATRYYKGSFDCNLQVKQKNQDDESIARAIGLQLGDTPGVSYREIADEALECGREELAIRVSTTHIRPPLSN